MREKKGITMMERENIYLIPQRMDCVQFSFAFKR